MRRDQQDGPLCPDCGVNLMATRRRGGHHCKARVTAAPLSAPSLDTGDVRFSGKLSPIGKVKAEVASSPSPTQSSPDRRAPGFTAEDAVIAEEVNEWVKVTPEQLRQDAEKFSTKLANELGYLCDRCGGGMHYDSCERCKFISRIADLLCIFASGYRQRDPFPSPPQENRNE